jgi:hypothetical protein
MGYTVQEIIDELTAMVEGESCAPEDGLMLDVAGRWTGIKGIYPEAGNLVMIESQD